MNTAWSLYRYILKAATRERFFLSIVGALAVVISLSYFFGSSSVTEKASFATSFAAFGLRLFGVCAISLFVINYIRRCFDARDIDYLLSRPIGRPGFILVHAAAFSTLAIITSIILGGTIVLLEFRNLTPGLFLWWVSIGAEFVIMANVAMFFAFVMRSSTACTIIVFAFYLLTRLMGDILGILHYGKSGKVMQAMAQIMEFISIFLPRLDLMGQTKWILYGLAPEVSLGFILAQCSVFCALIIGATMLDLKRRQF